MRLSQQENRMKSRLKYYTRSKLLIIDELVFLLLHFGDERLLSIIITRKKRLLRQIFHLINGMKFLIILLLRIRY